MNEFKAKLKKRRTMLVLSIVATLVVAAVFGVYSFNAANTYASDHLRGFTLGLPPV